MLRIAYGILQEQHLAEDAVQDAFAAAGQIAGLLDHDCEKTKNTLRLIARRKAINLYNKKKLQLEQTVELTDILQNNIADTMQNQGALMTAINELKPSYRRILLLRFDEGYTTKEVAQILSISEENAKRRLTRAKAALWKELHEEK